MLAGFEALVRWNRAGNVVLPKDFVALAEETGQIIELGKFVLAEACRQMRKLQDAGMPAVPVAVNISARQFADPGFVDYLAATLQTSGLAPRCLELEITESTLMNSVEHGAGVIAQIKQLGVSIAIEDFGTGYSSLAYLHQLPVHRIKIDEAFVQAMTARNDVGIVQTIIGLAKHMGLDVVAKGVETQGQAEQLALLQCDHMQGDYYSHPLTSSALAAWPSRFQTPDTPDTPTARAQ
jgi:EAL domain-containing protein (putative c-di-GMP-specific phosphodiesterase class I)